MTTKLYELVDADGNVRYVGKTIYSLANRLSRHLRETRKGNYYRAYWIRKQKELGKPISIRLIREVEGDGSAEEIALIAEYRKAGVHLINTTDGGEGIPGFKFSKESREKMSAAHRARMTPEIRKERSEAAKRMWSAKTEEEKRQAITRMAEASQALKKPKVEKQKVPREVVRANASARAREWHASMSPEDKLKRKETYKRTIANRSEARRKEISDRFRERIDPVESARRAKALWASRSPEERELIGKRISEGRIRNSELRKQAEAERLAASCELPTMGRP